MDPALKDQLDDIRRAIGDQSSTHALGAEEVGALRRELAAVASKQAGTHSLVERLADCVWRDNGDSLATRVRLNGDRLERLEEALAAILGRKPAAKEEGDAGSPSARAPVQRIGSAPAIPPIAWFCFLGLVLLALGLLFGPDEAAEIVKSLP